MLNKLLSRRVEEEKEIPVGTGGTEAVQAVAADTQKDVGTKDNHHAGEVDLTHHTRLEATHRDKSTTHAEKKVTVAAIEERIDIDLY